MTATSPRGSRPPFALILVAQRLQAPTVRSAIGQMATAERFTFEDDEIKMYLANKGYTGPGVSVQLVESEDELPGGAAASARSRNIL